MAKRKRNQAAELGDEPAPDVFDEAIQARQEAPITSPEQFEAEAAALKPMTPEELRAPVPPSQPEPVTPEPQDRPGTVIVGSEIKERAPQPFKSQPGFGWVGRYDQPVRFRIWSQKNEKNKQVFMLKFEMPKGAEKPPEEVIDVLRAHKYIKGGEFVGLEPGVQNDAEAFRTGLHWRDDRFVQKTWEWPADQMGEDIKFSLTAQLDKVAEQVRGRNL